MALRPALVFDKESVVAFVPRERATVYRLYSAMDRLVYVGASVAPRSRLLAHLRAGMPAKWVELEFFRSTTAMARAERAAIAEEESELPSGPARRHQAWRTRG